jgi:hypothetical protein
MNPAELPLSVSWFETAMPDGLAVGDQENTTWDAFASSFWLRREGEKDGCCFVPATFRREPDERHVRRFKRNLIARTAIALDCETNKKTGEVPVTFATAVKRLKASGRAAVVYTSHNHTPASPRYRIVMALSEPIAADLPAVEVVAERLGLLSVVDRSKFGGSAVFYMPSAPDGQLEGHETVIVEGDSINAAWMRERAGALLAARQAEAERISCRSFRSVKSHPGNLQKRHTGRNE